jgi:hypothetical protein
MVFFIPKSSPNNFQLFLTILNNFHPFSPTIKTNYYDKNFRNRPRKRKKHEKTVRETEKITGVTKTVTCGMKIKKDEIEKN